MTSAPDPADHIDMALPRDPAEYSLRRHGFGLAFWAMIVFGLLCVAAGFAVSRYGPTLFPPKVTPAPPASSAPSAVVAPPIAPPGDLQTAPPQATLAAAPEAAPSAEVRAISGRLDRLEADQHRAAHAAAEALAAADLSEVSQGSLPFEGQLAAVDRLLPDSADLRALRPLAAVGAPSRAALASELSGLADRAAVAARAPAPDAGVLTQIAHALASVFTVRRVDKVNGASPDAVLARAQAHANDGDIEGALKALDGLPKGGQAVLADWRAQAQRRVAIDRRIAALRAGALRDLTPMSEAWATP
ncbi:COG4223 family protein [Phenylobacterium montanum]|uniref:Uncharacterized protein n=1 Tax=Phenylobacterium montanum TaxID=2823693 RepID=A0A975FXD6_9CAUL|nr:hypothetical protein [Caulobacter sp. S6]QUD86989.1 hypothetical protein KCG34_18225 [Caulobacter sp. S6]